jgi:cell division protease FtsH
MSASREVEIQPDEDAEVEDYFAPVPPLKPAMVRVDPGMIAARLMLLRCVRDERLRRKLSADGVTAVLAVPGPEWVALVAAQWQAQFRQSEDPGDGDASGFNRRRSWITFRRTGVEAGHKPETGNDVAAEAIWSGISVVGFAPSPDAHLPESLMRAADHNLVVASLDVRQLKSLISELTGRTPSALVPDDLPARLTPSILRLARRQRQSADAYLARLISMAARKPVIGRPGPTLADVHGMDAATDWGKAWVRDLNDFRGRRISWQDIGVGILLVGPPGTGKTMFAEALARSADVPLVSTSFAEWQATKSGHLGDCLKAMRDAFEKAKSLAPSILFIDEMDALGSRDTSNSEHRDYWTSVITCFLELMDGVGGREGVLVAGATNNASVVDPAILRSGRMDRVIEVRLPDQAALIGILRYHLHGDLDGSDLTDAARRAAGGSGADCVRWTRSARQTARHAQRPMILDDLLHEIAGEGMDPVEERRVAAHEAGHAVVISVLRPGKLIEVRLGKVGRTGGAAALLAEVSTDREAIHGEILGLLAGRAAEEVVLGSYSGGCGGSPGSDIAQATCLATAMETALGLGDGGLVWCGMPTPETIGMMLAYRPQLAVRVGAYLDGAYQEAVALVREHERAVAAVMEAVIAARSLTGEEVAGLIAEHTSTGRGMAAS